MVVPCKLGSSTVNQTKLAIRGRNRGSLLYGPSVLRNRRMGEGGGGGEGGGAREPTPERDLHREQNWAAVGWAGLRDRDSGARLVQWDLRFCDAKTGTARGMQASASLA